MRTHIVDATRELLATGAPASDPPTLDEVAASAGITSRQLRAYYTSVEAIRRELTSLPDRTTEM
ncbi:hypothetical protein AB0878_45050 [Amycolatopsis sp. NPDC047767]|uniref:hypothetical protein n=1 Tax=Amycolatopsis sp. NPDC047767 TaxID=3156765 RepID=UPI0034512650